MREWLASLVGDSLAPIVSVVVSAAIVLLLAMVIIGLAKRIFAGTGGIGGRSRAPRLAILDVSPVDQKRKLVLIRRDDMEHLILIGGQNDLVVESGIQRVRTRRVEPAAPGRMEAEQAPESRPAAPVRRVPPVEPQVAPPAPPPVVPAMPVAREQNAPARSAPVPSPATVETIEPADLKATPAAVRSQAPDRAPERFGERPLPLRPPSEERSQAAAAEPSPPALPAFLGVMPGRQVSAARTATPVQPQQVAPIAPPAVENPRAAAATEHAGSGPQPVSQPVVPRSMATPTLPAPAPASRNEAVRPNDNSANARSSTPPAAPPLIAQEPLVATETSESAPTHDGSSTPASAPPTAEATMDPSQSGATTERQPLSVRSFATTIQARRTTPPAPPAVPVPVEPRPVAAEPTEQPSVPPMLPVRPPSSEPEGSTRTIPVNREPTRTTPEPASEAEAPARTLTLEEEMERLLHDFTLDVSDRR